MSDSNRFKQVEIEFKAQNPHLEKYTSIMSLIFFIANGLNAVLFQRSLGLLKQSDRGLIMELIAFGFLLSLLFNLPYKLVVPVASDGMAHILFDTLNNTTTITFTLFLNLVLSHAITASDRMSSRSFFLPKLLVCIGVFLSMWNWQLADQRNYVGFFKNDFKETEEDAAREKTAFIMFSMAMIIYAVLFGYHHAMVLFVAPCKSNARRRFTPQTCGLLFFLSTMTAGLLAVPFES